MTFTDAELSFLRQQQIGRLGTIDRHGQPQIRPVGVHLTADRTGIEIVGHALAGTQKWRNVLENPKVAFIVDEVASIRPPRARGVEIRGTATVHPGAGTTDGGLSGDVIRITPRRIVSWGLDAAETTARSVD
ncbi:PPOX class F420-dependent oxidoreductase [Mycobacterium sp. AMU20-3851]|uniref:PPOX class F420-dependent oxidoreductase n=1 Tax=Mycobacterium sp. AMU20-3851 TaxID=3122055 RepID=UPI003754003C